MATIGVLGLLLAACGGDDPAAEDGPSEPASGSVATDDAATDAEAMADPVTDEADLLVVVTTSILGDIVETLVGDDGTVEVLMPPGTDPHGYQPSAAETALLREADLVVANGLRLEENLLAGLAAATEEGVPVLELADQLDPIAFGDDGHDHAHDDDHAADDDHANDDDHDHAHDHGPEDPHVWFDPVRMADGAVLLAEELAAVDDRLDSAEWEARGQAYADELLVVHEDVEAILAEVPEEDRLLVTNHDALGYLAERYGFEVVGTVVPGSSTQVETDARSFAALVETVEETGVPAIFAEHTDRTTLAEQLRSEVAGRSDLDLEVVRLHTGAIGEPGSGAETYPDLLRTNARLIADALG